MFPKINGLPRYKWLPPVTSTRLARREVKKDAESLFKWTRDRFLADEANLMAMHRVDFNVDALARAASRATKGASCKSIIKIFEGPYHKCYELHMRNGRSLVAKIPLPHVSIPHLTCANQVATMDFARSVLKLPAPEVLGWNSRLGAENPVGAEYILMKKVPGIPLDCIWRTNKFTKKHLEVFARQIAYIEKCFLDMTFRNIGAIYYKGDVDRSEPLVYTKPEGEMNDSRFVIGPVTGHSWMLNGRCTLECDRGPWDNSIDYLKAIGNRELLASDTAPQLPQDLEWLLGPDSYRPTAAKNHRIGSMYLKLIEHIVPTHSPIAQYRLWNNRLDTPCIFVDAHDHGKITGITGWDNTQIAPLYKQQLELPDFSHCIRNANAAYGYEEDPALSEDLDDEPFCGSCKTQNLSNEVLRLNQRPDILHAQKYQRTTAGHFLRMGEHLFDEDQALMAHMVLELQKLWKRKEAFPVRLTHRRIKSIRIAMKQAHRAGDNADRLRGHMEKLMPWYGSVSHEKYKKSKRKLAMYRKLFVKSGWIHEKDWPYDC